jgi:hypothetical protein
MCITLVIIEFHFKMHGPYNIKLKKKLINVFKELNILALGVWPPSESRPTALHNCHYFPLIKSVNCISSLPGGEAVKSRLDILSQISTVKTSS